MKTRSGEKIRSVTSGDVLHVYGNVGYTDYTFRLCIRLDEEIDGEILKEALESTQERFYYLNLRLRKDEASFYYEENDAPVCLFHTDQRTSLNSEESNHHVWAVCYSDDTIYLDFFHGIIDGQGSYTVLSTLLYYYCRKKYGDYDKTGIRTLDDVPDDREFTDPVDHLPDLDPKILLARRTARAPAFSLISDGGMTPCEKGIIRDVMVPEKRFLEFTSANDASPGTFINVIMARAIESITPSKEKNLIGSYIINARPMLDFPYTHHNCVNTAFATFTDQFKKMSLDRQCTSMRGMTFLQSDRDRVVGAMMGTKAIAQMNLQIPTLKGKQEAFHNVIERGKTMLTYMVSYTGQWKHRELGKHIVEFWTHAPITNDFLVEISAANGNIFLSFHQSFKEDAYYRAILRQLSDNGIAYTEIRTIENDISHFSDVKDGRTF